MSILSIFPARSEVFKAMFRSKMTESIKNVVEIEDFDEETVRGMLEFIYTGKTKMAKESPMGLLKIADKYQLWDLKSECETVILAQLNFENAAEILSFAEFHSPVHLKPQVINFMTQ